MRRVAVLRLVAIALYGVYWGLWVFGYTRVDIDAARPFSYAAVVLPCFLVGAAIGNRWAPAVGLVFVAFVPLPDRCVEDRVGADVTLISCSGLSAQDLPLVLSITTPCVVAGVVAATLLSGWRRRDQAPEPLAG